MRKLKHKPYYFELHSIALLKEMDMSPNYLYEGWRTIPAHLRQLQVRYLNGDSGGWSAEKQIKNIMQRDLGMYYGILEMLKKRVTRVSNVKSEDLIDNNYQKLGWKFQKTGIDKRGLSFKNYIGNQPTKDIVNKRNMMLHFQSEFVRTGQVKNITTLRKLDKELVAEIKEFLKKR